MRINLASTRLAFVLIALLLVLVLLSALIPQKEFADYRVSGTDNLLDSGHGIVERLQLDSIYTSWYFYTILALLAVNLTFGTFRRSRNVLRVEGTLLRARHLGSILFHLSLLLLMFAVILNYLYKYSGQLALTEGQQVQDSAESYQKESYGPLSSTDYGRFRLRLDKVDLHYPIAGAEATAAMISLWPDRQTEPLTGELVTNRPLVFDDMEVHYALTYGYSPELVILDSTGSQTFRSFVRLATQQTEQGPSFSDFYVDEGSELHVQMSVLPNDINIDSSYIKLHIEQAGVLLIEDTVRLGDSVRVAGWTVVTPRLRHWCYLNVVTNPFLYWVFVGFWSALIGLTISFVPRVIRARKSNDNQ